MSRWSVCGNNTVSPSLFISQAFCRTITQENVQSLFSWLLSAVLYTLWALLVSPQIPRRYSTSLHMFWNMLWSTVATGLHAGFRLLKMRKNPLWSSLANYETGQWALFCLSILQPSCDWHNSSPGLLYQNYFEQSKALILDVVAAVTVCFKTREKRSSYELSSGYLS